MKRALPIGLVLVLAVAACDQTAETPTQVVPEIEAPSLAVVDGIEQRVGTTIKAGVNDGASSATDGTSSTGRLGTKSGAFGPSVQSHGAGLATQSLGVGGLTMTQLAQDLAGPGVVIQNVTYSGVSQAAGRFHGGTGIIGFESGIILGSGNINLVPGPNSSGSITANNGQPGDAALTTIAGVSTYDRAILQFDFIPNGSQIAFEYVFSSDEYNEYAPSSYNDPFAFFVNGQNCAQVNGSPVTINNVRLGNNAAFYRSNAAPTPVTINTEMDGLTVVLVCQATVNPGVVNTIRLAIADAGDASYDSNVFIKAGSFSTDVPGQISLSPSTATAPESPAATHTVTAQVRFANGVPRPGVTVAFEVISGPNAGATGSGVTDSFGQTTFTWTDINGDGTDVVEASYTDPADNQTYTDTAEMIWTSVNDAPVANAGGPYTGDEGTAVSFDGSGSTDADGDALTYAWDFGDGNTGTGVSPSHTYADNGSYTVSLVVNDGEEDSAPVTTTAEIANVAPVVTMPAGATLDEGGTFSGSGSFTDPGADSWSATVDYGDGSGVQALALAGKSFSLSHSYADNGSYTVTVVVTETDPEAASGSGTATVEVDNVAPSVSAGGDVSLIAGDDFALAGSFSDPGVDDAPWDWSVDFDGSSASGSTNDQSAAITPTSHAYLAAGTYTVVLSVTDKDGATGSDELLVTVERQPAGIDIKPGSYPNSINFGNKGNGKSASANGTVPVAILGSATFDATQVDLATVTLGDLSGTDTPVAKKNNGTWHAATEDVNGDGYMDLVLHFERAALIANGDLVSSSTSLTLIGALNSGLDFVGSDSVNIVP